MDASVLLCVDDLSAFYGGKTSLHHISMAIPPHAITAVIGPSGCGKSTFIRCLNRMNDFILSFRITGSVRYKGQNLYDPETDVIEIRRQIGMVFQKPNPFPKSIFDNVAYGLRIQKNHTSARLQEVVETSLKKAAIWDEVKDRLDQPALSLSGGQQQRLCIARALAVEPAVLLLDEPTSAIDPIATARIEDLLRELKKNYTIVLVTHNMQQAARVADQVGFFLDGHLIELEAASRIFTRPRDPRTEDYITGRFG